MPQIPTQFRRTGEAPLVTFDFTNFITKTGYVRFYLAQDAGGAGFLSPQQIRSDTVDTEYTANATDSELTFDVTFKTQQRIEGDAYVSVAQAIQLNSGDSGTATIKVDAELFHVDAAATATSIGSDDGVACTVAQTSGATNSAKYGLLKIAISETVFRPGETLRLKLYVTITGITGSNGFAAVGHDPLGRDADYDDANQGALKTTVFDWSESAPANEVRTDSLLDVPFKIDL